MGRIDKIRALVSDRERNESNCMLSVRRIVFLGGTWR
jgi:hypothetical protein